MLLNYTHCACLLSDCSVTLFYKTNTIQIHHCHIKYLVSVARLHKSNQIGFFGVKRWPSSIAHTVCRSDSRHSDYKHGVNVTSSITPALLPYFIISTIACLASA